MTRIRFVLDEKYELSGTGLVRESTRAVGGDS